ncbi:MAG: putative quinol monooxygenase [Marmoricola sp.]
MIVVEAWMTCHPEAAEEFATAAVDLVEATLTEPDFLAYECTRSLADPSRFVFVEHWPDLAALGRHARSRHYEAFAARAEGWVAARSILIHDVATTNEAE